jgi:hypothetical protein
MVSQRILALQLTVLLTACGDDPCPRGSMLDSVEGLELTQEEHPTGWGLDCCSECHATAVLHRIGCTPDMDLDAIRGLVADDGLDSCADCHGDNGVER